VAAMAGGDGEQQLYPSQRTSGRNDTRAFGDTRPCAGGQKVRFLALGIGKSVVIDLPREAKDVLVADPKIIAAQSMIRWSEHG
jgi:Flp pilus assembly secretin CpaC